MNLVVAVDGPAGSGKSTVSRELARELSLHHVDSGAMYRLYTWFLFELAQKSGQSVSAVLESPNIVEILSSFNFEISFENSRQLLIVDGKDMDVMIRSPEIASQIKPVADNVQVRQLVNEKIRHLAKTCSIIVDGRDIGTVVFPDAKFKFFITADPRERAKRRLKEFEQNHPGITLNEVEEAIRRRDEDDRNRSFGALKQATDAIFIDTTSQKINAVVNKLKGIVLNTHSG